MSSNNKKLIAVIGATGQQGGGVVRALQARGQFRVRALTRNPDKHRALAEEVVAADLDKPETLKVAFEGAHGVFLVTNFWAHGGTDELTQATAAIRVAKDAGVKHFIWSTLPDVEAISGGKFKVPHFTGKAKIDRIVKEAEFENYSFVIPPFTTRTFWALWLRKSRRTDLWAGLFLLIRLCGSFTWATSTNSATSWPAHSHTRMRRAMVSICHSLAIS
jgi:NmrA-like family